MRASILSFGALLSVLSSALSQAHARQQQPFVLPSSSFTSSLLADISTTQHIELPFGDFSTAQAASNEEAVESRIAAHSSAHRGASGFVTLSHEEFPYLSVRIRQHGGAFARTSTKDGAKKAMDPEAWCDPTVKSWTGYIDTIDGKSLWFQFFESRSDPKKDPLLLWTNGGPGCSSAIGLFQELGPCRVPLRNGAMPSGPAINGTEFNEWSWNSQSSIIFIDQPVDVGFSYSRFGVHTYNADQGARDLYAFLRIFFDAFPRFAENESVITTESYGGRYAPRYASEIVDRNAEVVHKAARKGEEVDRRKLINLKAVAIGNGLTSPAEQMTSEFDMLCTRKGGAKTPYLPIGACKRMEVWKKKCDKILPIVCQENFSQDECQMHIDACQDEISGPYAATGRNPYNVEDDCKAGIQPNLCYDVVGDIRQYLDRPDVRELIGAASVEQIGNFTTCNWDVNSGFERTGDEIVDNVGYASGLLERGIRMLFYVGKLDLSCNWVGNKRWLFNMDWYGKEKFLAAENRGWVVDGEIAGETQSAEGLTWATILGAGHMVPYDKPVQAKNLIYRWLAGEPL
ncbi:hypothetical protein A4X09_0g3474 [Tilletia walkeri]|uniref:Carboxypeptidase n=1 Tax=Tilletia walkeri TaxID=117179 RepID=A0A8X7N8V8_9BASI|nr:hypothetical protein A4X09_0g3474 [Tilletia walkeri]